MKYPKNIIDQLGKDELISIINDSALFQKIEEDPVYIKFWKTIKETSETRKETLEKQEYQGILGFRKEKEIKANIMNDYIEEIDEVIKNKNITELLELENESRETLNTTKFLVDLEYWEEILKKIVVERCNMELLEVFELKFGEKSQKLIEEANINIKEAVIKEKGLTEEELNQCLVEETLYKQNQPEVEVNFNNQRHYPGLEDVWNTFPVKSFADFSNRLNEKREEILDKELDEMRGKLKYQIKKRQINRSDVKTYLDKMKVVDENMDEDELFKNLRKKAENDEDVDDDEYLKEEVKVKKDLAVIEKYKPRKPHYYNRVKLGYEWNKVNQTHYDLDNPPPKEVQGYKFNVFYPNLIGKDVTPNYVLETHKDNPNFCFIRFHAGPPYEDIKFMIVNKQWDLSDRHGFKCVFDHGILHLHFNFVKVRYRR